MRGKIGQGAANTQSRFKRSLWQFEQARLEIEIVQISSMSLI